MKITKFEDIYAQKVFSLKRGKLYILSYSEDWYKTDMRQITKVLPREFKRIANLVRLHRSVRDFNKVLT